MTHVPEVGGEHVRKLARARNRVVFMSLLPLLDRLHHLCCDIGKDVELA